MYGITGEGNLFKPGTMTGQVPQLVKYTKGSDAYKTDWDNIAPSVGVVWQPRVENGMLSKIISSEPVFRGGYSKSYEAPGFSGFTSIFANNPGASRSATRSIANGTLGTDGQPVLLRETARLQPLAAPVASYPFVPATNESINAFDPNTELSYTHSYSVGFQRQLGRNMAIEVQYIGNQNLGQTFEWDINSRRELEHPGERLLPGIPEGAGKPPRQRRGRPRGDVRLYRRPARLRCRSSWLT